MNVKGGFFFPIIVYTLSKVAKWAIDWQIVLLCHKRRRLKLDRVVWMAKEGALANKVFRVDFERQLGSQAWRGIRDVNPLWKLIVS